MRLNKKRGEGNSTNWGKKLKFNISLIDLFTIVLSITIVLILRFPSIFKEEITTYELRNILLSFLVFFSWFFFLGFNKSRDVKILGFGADEYKKIVNSTLMSFTFVAFISYIFKLEISRAFVLIVYPFGLLTLFIVRRSLRKRLIRARNQGRYLSKVLLLQSIDPDPVEIRLSIATHAGLLITKKIKVIQNTSIDIHEIIKEAKNNDCDQIMVGQSAQISALELRKLGWALEDTSIDLVVAPAVTEIAGPRLKVSNVEGLPLLHLEQPNFSGFAILTKRILDVTLSILAIIFTVPLFIIISLLIKIFDGGPIFYKQKRIGKSNEEFIVFKFRTMREGSHEMREQVMAETNKDPRLAKNPNDPRITKPGAFLRRWSIDELPQLFNVLKGEMSLVGPRPPLAEEVDQYKKSEKRRLLVKPGLTGLWQVSGRSELDWEDAVRLDLYYVENWSLTLDLLIILRTAAAVWRGEGAY